MSCQHGTLSVCTGCTFWPCRENEQPVSFAHCVEEWCTTLSSLPPASNQPGCHLHFVLWSFIFYLSPWDHSKLFIRGCPSVVLGVCHATCWSLWKINVIVILKGEWLYTTKEEITVNSWIALWKPQSLMSNMKRRSLNKNDHSGKALSENRWGYVYEHGSLLDPLYFT